MSAAVNVVLGAGGPTGLECVKRLLEATTAPVAAVVRDPAKYEESFKTTAAEIGTWSQVHACTPLLVVQLLLVESLPTAFCAR